MSRTRVLSFLHRFLSPTSRISLQLTRVFCFSVSPEVSIPVSHPQTPFFLSPLASPSWSLKLPFFLRALGHSPFSQTQALSGVIPLVMDFTHFSFPLSVIPTICFVPSVALRH